MRKSKFSETHNIGILKNAETGVAVNDLLRKHGVSRTTFFKWSSKYGGASVSDVKRLREDGVGLVPAQAAHANRDVCLRRRHATSAPESQDYVIGDAVLAV